MHVFYRILAFSCVFSALFVPGYTWGEPIECDGPVVINEFVAAASSQTTPPLQWTTTSYDDSEWRTGAGGLGYSDGDDATVVNIQNQAKSLYLRTLFSVTVPDSAITFSNGGSEEGSFSSWTVTGKAWRVISSGQGFNSTPIDGTSAASSNYRGSVNPDALNGTLMIQVDYDDGFVAYLNGKEIARRNMGTAGGEVSYDQLAQGEHEAGTPETILVGATADYLYDGSNVLAIEVHNDALDSTDLSLIADLFIATSSPTYLVRHEDIWNYFIGTHSPNPPAPFLDEDDEASDWIELHNTSTERVSLQGWSLTDSENTPDKWVFPAVSIDPGGFLVVFASGKDLTVSTKNLHTNFKLNIQPEYLGLYDHANPRQLRCGFLPKYPFRQIQC